MTGVKRSPASLPKHVKRVVAKGKEYFYFDTGRRVDGKRVYAPLPHLRDPKFGGSLAALQGHRTRNQQTRDRLLVPKLIDLFERSEAYRKKRPSTQRLYGIYLRRLEQLMPTAPVDEITRGDMRRLVDNMADTPGAANALLGTAGALFSWGVKREYLQKNPCAGVDKLDGGEHEPWPEHILEAALASDDAFVRLLVHMLYFTAQRINDVLRMTWTDLAGGRVRIRTTKTEADLDIPQHAMLKTELARHARVAAVIVTIDGKPVNEQLARARLQAFTASLGHKTVPHGLRKNAVMALLEVGCSMAETAAVSQQSLQMVEHYGKRRNRVRLADSAVLRWEGRTMNVQTKEN